VDAIYIDPPYNSGAKDWKYNNDYVEGDDLYRHSKWLAMIERRLFVAKQLLNPADSVLIVTIDEKEYLRLGLLLQQTFPEANMQMISTLINSKGTGRANEFRRIDEYIYFLWFGEAKLGRLSSPQAVGSDSFHEEDDIDEGGVFDEPSNEDSDSDSLPEKASVGLDWQTFRRRDLASRRGTKKGGPRQFYPIYVNESTGQIEAVGDPLPHDMPRSSAPERKNCVAVFPLRKDGTEMNWSAIGSTFSARWKDGYARAGKATPEQPQKYIIQYLKAGSIKDIEEGRATILGKNPDGSVIAEYPEAKIKTPTTQWAFKSHNAEHYGTGILTSLIPNKIFPFPKSLYAVEDALRIFIAEKPSAVVLDFFSGSGTTAHAVMRLNRQDGGSRQSISVTNNEVAALEQSSMRKSGMRPGDSEWEKHGICDFITKPRLHAAITGKTSDGKPVKGNYKFNDEFPMADGFEENAEFFTLTYETPVSVSHSLAFSRIAALLWLRAGAFGKRIDKLPSDGWAVTDAYGLLTEVDVATPFVKAMNMAERVRVAYIVTDDDRRFQAIAKRLPNGVESVRLYESYLTNFSFTNGE
jgi:adenine-specific DNA-methyltransferase